jgi:hypothetical protein
MKVDWNEGTIICPTFSSTDIFSSVDCTHFSASLSRPLGAWAMVRAERLSAMAVRAGILVGIRLMLADCRALI